MKKLIWIGSSYEDLKDFPTPVRSAMGYALLSGIATPKKEIEMIKSRLKEAKALYQEIKKEKKK